MLLHVGNHWSHLNDEWWKYSKLQEGGLSCCWSISILVFWGFCSSLSWRLECHTESSCRHKSCRDKLHAVRRISSAAYRLAPVLQLCSGTSVKITLFTLQPSWLFTTVKFHPNVAQILSPEKVQLFSIRCCYVNISR